VRVWGAASIRGFQVARTPNKGKMRAIFPFHTQPDACGAVSSFGAACWKIVTVKIKPRLNYAASSLYLCSDDFRVNSSCCDRFLGAGSTNAVLVDGTSVIRVL